MEKVGGDADWDLPGVPTVEGLRGGPLPPSVKLTKEQEDALHDLGVWMREQGLPETADSHLVKFINSCDYNVEVAKKCAKDYFHGRETCPELFTGWDVNLPNIKSILEIFFLSVLPRRTPEGHRIIMSYLRTSDTTNYFIDDVTKVVLMIMESVFLTEPELEGLVIIHDLKNATFTHFLKAAWGMNRKVQEYMQTGVPLKRHRVHLVNCSSFVDAGLKLMKPFGRKEDWEMLRVHKNNDFTALHSEIPKHCLPSDVGGTLPSLEETRELNLRRLEDFVEIFRNRGMA